MKGTERITAIIRSHVQSTWNVICDVVWSNTDADGEVSILLSAETARHVITPAASWWRILDKAHLTAFAVETVRQNPDGSVCVRARRTPIFALERNRIQSGPNHVHRN